ncbi:MAG: Mur ligase family protein, partial [Spirochaetales bacterium]|nr:Mur ligase family protein [Spirochaetales bacterium]
MMAQDRQHILFAAGELGGMIGAACKGNLDAAIMDVVTDSRLVRAGVLFVALRGARVDGHRFIEDACRAGAAAIMAEMAQKDMALAAFRNAGCMDRACLLLVESTLSGLQAAACAYRRRMHLFRIGVTGSSGKTTTKECIGAILRACYPDNTVAMNEGNLNSDIGLALAMFTLRPEHRIGVFEMGMNRKGEMDELVAMYEPDMAVITNIGTAHLGMLGSRQAIAEEKKKIFSRFTGSQRGFIWENDDYRDFLARDVQGTIMEFGPRST